MIDEGEKISANFAGMLGTFSFDVAFEAPMRGVTALFGPSGSGKTTTLRCIAGLERLAGHLSIGGEIWQDDRTRIFCQPHKRSIGYIFQEPSLFAHLTVRKNLLYGAQRASRNGAIQAVKEDDVVDLLGIGHLLERSPSSLSGGERQRVAVGRALLSQPRLLLMDEPLSGLDSWTKQEIFPYFETLHQQLSIPILYVSHDMSEIDRLADRLIVLDHGKVLTSGPLCELKADPALPFLHASDAGVTIEGRVAAFDESYGMTVFSVSGGTLLIPGLHGQPGSIRRLRISASDVSFSLVQPEGTTILNGLPCRIVSITAQNQGVDEVLVVAGLGENGDGARIVARIMRKSCELLDLAPGRSVFAQINGVALPDAGNAFRMPRMGNGPA